MIEGKGDFAFPLTGREARPGAGLDFSSPGRIEVSISMLYLKSGNTQKGEASWESV